MDARFASALKTFIELLPRSKYRPVTPVGQLLWNQHIQAFENAIFAKPGSGVTPQTALDESTTIVQRELDRIVVPESGAEVSWTTITTIYASVLLLAAIGFSIWFFTRFTGRQQAREEAYAGWLFASPWIVGFIVFTGGPILFSLIMSFCTYDALSPSHFVGLRNFKEAFTQDPLVWKSLYNTVFMVLGVPLGMMVGLGVAMLLDANVRYIAVYRTLFYLPSIVPGVASALLWMLIFNSNEGILNWALAKIGISGPNWLQDPAWSKPALIVHGLWGAGSGMIVWLAGLKAIPQDLYEAAALDGAGPVRRFMHITLPMLTPYIFFNLVMGLIGTFQIFGQAYLMTAGGPVNSTLFYAYNLFNQAFRYLHMGYAGALAWILFAIIFVLTLYQLRMSKRWVHYQGE
jgi:multiple sugar transport system permease protein